MLGVAATLAVAALGGAPKYALLMSDNREPTLGGGSAPTYPALAFALNALYACRHGYDLLYYRMAAPSCRHAVDGERHASYCKLPAIAQALAEGGYAGVAFIDSDSFFLHRNASLPQILRRYAPPAAATPAAAAAWFANDLPQLGERPNGGLHVWLAGPDAHRVLRTWWHLPSGKYGVEHDYEQHSLQWALGNLAAAAPLLGTLQLRAMADSFHHAVAHIDHTKAERRLWVMAVELIAAALEAPSALATTATGRRPLAPRLRSLLRQAREVPPPPAEPPASLVKRTLRAAAELLRAGFGAPAGGLAVGGPAARCPAGPAGAQPADAAAAAAGSLRAIEYDPSALALSALPPVDLLPAEGLPLVLEPCSAGARVLQRWRALPGGGWSLAAHPSLCLAVGPRKAPKTPYPMLAQLRRCAAHGSAPAADATFEHDARGGGGGEGGGGGGGGGGPLRTRASPSSLAEAVSAAAAAARAAQRQPGRRLVSRSRRSLKPKGGPKGAQRLGGKKKRGKQPFWQDGVVSRGGDGGGGRLCLGTWRSQASAGASVVFSQCDEDSLGVTLLGADEGADGQRMRLGDDTEGGLCVSATVDGVAWPLGSGAR